MKNSTGSTNSLINKKSFNTITAGPGKVNNLEMKIVKIQTISKNNKIQQNQYNTNSGSINLWKGELNKTGKTKN